MALNRMLRVADYRGLLERMLKDYGLSAESLEIVPSVREWCRANGVPEENPFRTAKCLCRRSDNACHIVMNETLSDSAIGSAKSSMFFRGFENEVKSLDADEKFLIHLMLHEIACHLLKVTEQKPRDRWAFQEMSKYAI